MNRQDVKTRGDVHLWQAQKGHRPRLLRVSQSAAYDRTTKQRVWLGHANTRPSDALMYDAWAQLPV